MIDSLGRKPWQTPASLRPADWIARTLVKACGRPPDRRQPRFTNARDSTAGCVPGDHARWTLVSALPARAGSWAFACPTIQTNSRLDARGVRRNRKGNGEGAQGDGWPGRAVRTCDVRAGVASARSVTRAAMPGGRVTPRAIRRAALRGRSGADAACGLDSPGEPLVLIPNVRTRVRRVRDRIGNCHGRRANPPRVRRFLSLGRLPRRHQGLHATTRDQPNTSQYPQHQHGLSPQRSTHGIPLA